MLSPLNPWLIAGAAMALLVAGGVGYTKGYLSGVDSLTDDLVACNTTLNTVKEQQHALAKANDDLRKQSDAVTAERDLAWSAARDRAAVAPRVIRVRDAACSSDGKVHVSQPATGTDEAASGVRVGETGVVTLTLEEVNARINASELAYAQLAHLVAWVEDQERIHR